MKQAFPCSQCGLCCQHVDRSHETQFLDQGDGTCKHYDPTKQGCRIYDNRPDICRVDVMYAQRYSASYDWNQFIELNLQACSQLQNKANPAQDF